MVSNLLIEKAVRAALEEDLPNGRDITADCLIPENARAKAVFTAREDGILAGLIPALSAFSLLDMDFDMVVNARDGDTLTKGQEIAEIEGPAKALLTGERVALNFMTHLSGIATLTHKYVEKIKGTGAEICDTRKTLPGLRVLQKYAVQVGGGSNHRFSLSDAVLIKDNHIAIAGDISTALQQACLLAGHTQKIEIEVDTLDQLAEVLAFTEENNGAVDIVMLDNMDVKTLEKAVSSCKGKIRTEASGGITLENVHEIAQTGVDYISIGALTHSAQALDIGLDIHT